MRSALAILSAAALSACATAAHVVYPVNQEATKARAGDYTLDPDHASVIFAVDHLGFSTFYGRFDTLSGRLHLDKDHPEASEAAITIAAASVDTRSKKLDDELKGAAMFDAGAHPDILFVTTKIVRTGDKTADVDGLLTIKDKTLPVALKAEFHGSGKFPGTNERRVGFDARTTIKRSAFGLDAWNGFVGDDVTLILAAEFTAK